MAPIVMTDTNGSTPAVGDLFDGVSFFLVQRLPSRSSYVDRIHANGGRVVKLEAQADHVIADHLRRDCPPGSLSYTFIDTAISTSALPDPADHLAGPAPGSLRPVGSTSAPGKGTRTPFSAEDDRVLWQWVERARKDGGSVKGNEIYKQLERVNGRHTYQAWRDRYIKKLMDRPPVGADVVVSANAPPSPPTDAQDGERDELQRDEIEVAAESSKKRGKAKKNAEIVFDEDDFESLMLNAKDIVKIPDDQLDNAWAAWATANTKHDAEGWKKGWQEKVLPAFQKQRKEAKRRKRSSTQESVAEEPAAKRGTGKEAIKAPVEAIAEEEDELQQPQSALKRKNDREGTVKESAGTVNEGDVDELQQPTSVTNGTPSSQHKRRRTSSAAGSQSAVSKYERYKKHRRDHPELFRRNDQEIPLVPPKPKPKLHAVNPTQPIEISSSDDDRVAKVQQEEEGMESPKQQQYDDVQMGMENDADDEPFQAMEPMSEDDMQAQQYHTPEANRAAEEQLRQESLGVNDEVERVTHVDLTPRQPDSYLPTSEANRAASRQLRRESGGGEDSTPQQVASNLTTSYASRAAEQQLRRESLGHVPGIDEVIDFGDNEDGYMADGDAGDVTISNHLVEDGEVEDGLPGEDILDEDDNEAGDALTEANLASQQAAHKEKLLRGLDIPQDDTQQDQTEFANYLEALVGKKDRPSEQLVTLVPAEAPALSSDPVIDQTQYTHNDAQLLPPSDQVEVFDQAAQPLPVFSSDHGNDDEEMIDQTQYTHNETNLFSDGLPFSSQQDIDDVLQDNLQWPASPERPKRSQPSQQPQSQAVRIEQTQVQYPTLPSQDDEKDEDMFTTQPPLPPLSEHGQDGPGYLTMLEEHIEASNNEIDARVSGDGDDVVRSQKRSGMAEDDGFVTVNGDEGVPAVTDGELDEEEQEDDEIDFSVPEPDGGFEFMSSPAEQAVQSVEERAQSQAEAEDDDDEDVDLTERNEPHPAINDAQTQRSAIEISSAESSSSPYESPEPPSPEPAARRDKGKARMLETQDILNMEMQQPDFSMPLPPDSDEEDGFEEMAADPLEGLAMSGVNQLRQPGRRVVTPPTHEDFSPTSPAQSTKQPQPQPQPTPRAKAKPTTASQSQPINLAETQTFDPEDDDVDSWIATIALRYNIADDGIITDALKCTSLRPELAEFVALEMKRGKGLPTDVAGVWSAEEDRVVEGGDARKMGDLAKKHGYEEVFARLKFLDAWRSG